jgi:hypothetical protein
MQKVESSSLFSRSSRKPCKSRGFRRFGGRFPHRPAVDGYHSWLPLSLGRSPNRLGSGAGCGPARRSPMPVRPRVYVRRVLILRLVFNALARAKLAARRDHHPRDRGGRRERAARARQPICARARLDLRDRPNQLSAILTVVLQPDTADPTRWHVMTGWDSDQRQIADYQSKR